VLWARVCRSGLAGAQNSAGVQPNSACKVTCLTSDGPDDSSHHLLLVPVTAAAAAPGPPVSDPAGSSTLLFMCGAAEITTRMMTHVTTCWWHCWCLGMVGGRHQCHCCCCYAVMFGVGFWHQSKARGNHNCLCQGLCAVHPPQAQLLATGHNAERLIDRN
jgi:hypothetical protein